MLSSSTHTTTGGKSPVPCIGVVSPQGFMNSFHLYSDIFYGEVLFSIYFPLTIHIFMLSQNKPVFHVYVWCSKSGGAN